MQINVLGDERRRRWSYDEKVRLVEETLQAGEAVCAGAGWLIACLFTWRRQMDQRRQLHRSGSARPLSRGIATLPTIMHSPRVRHADISEACRISPSFAVVNMCSCRGSVACVGRPNRPPVSNNKAPWHFPTLIVASRKLTTSAPQTLPASDAIA